MKTLNIVDSSNAIIVDHSTGDVDTLGRVSTEIDWMWVAPEDIMVQYKNKKGDTISLKAKKGDIILKFYVYSYTENPVIIVKNTKWKENIIAKNAEEEKEEIDKQAWAKKKNLEPCCDCCECCCDY